MTKSRRFPIFASLVAAAFLIYLFLDRSDEKKLGHQGVTEFHRKYNEGATGEIYALSHSRFKSMTSEEKFTGLLHRMQKNLGKVVHTTNTSWRVETPQQLSTIFLSQETAFERGSGMESFVFEVMDKKPVLVGYRINSEKMPTRPAILPVR